MEQSYKEKYEQAIERLKQWDREHPCAGYVLSDRDKFIFPELAESEDERIRNGLVRLLKELLELGGVAEDEWDRNECEKYIAWLEKQGEKKLVEENNGNIGGISTDEEAVLDALIRRLKGEDIYVSPHLAVECLESLKGRVLPKQEWSVEDEQHIDSLLKRLDALCRNKFERTRFAISEDKDWLKSLKDRVGCEAKCTTTKEWSEEDEEILRTILSDGIRGAELDMLQVNWLKSLRPQNHWKPSDEQMGCLSDAIEHYNSLGYPASKLKELLDDLKKIKGEV